MLFYIDSTPQCIINPHYRLLTKYFPDGKYNSKVIQTRYAEREQLHDGDYAAFKDLREETQMQLSYVANAEEI